MSKKKPRQQNRRIPSAAVPGARPLQFSFKHLDTENTKFSVSQCSNEFWQALVHELKRYSLFTVDQFVEDDHQAGRHVIDFQETTEPDGFTGFGEGEDSVAWQFAIGPRPRGWRVVGYIVDETVFIVWLDSGHSLYP